MKILFMADVPANPDSGAAGTEFQTIEATKAIGHEVDAVWQDDLPHRIRHGNLHYLFELPFAYRKVMRDRLRLKDYDVIHVNQPYGFLAAKLLKSTKRKCVFIHRSHGFELRVKRDLDPWIKLYSADKRPLVRRMMSAILSPALEYCGVAITRYADGHIVSSSQCAEYLSGEMRVPKERIAVIPQAPPVEFSEQPCMPMERERLRRILYVGQYAFIKAPMILAAVFDRLVKDCNDVKLTWVCSKDNHRKASELLKATTRRKVDFLDWMDQQSLMKIYDHHGIFLFPSFFEGFGKAFLEAMSRGLCVIAADNGGAHDVIKNGRNALLVPTGNVEAMVKACLTALTEPNFAKKLSEAAVNTAREYSWERVAKETVQFYQHRLDAKVKESLLK